MSIEKGSQNMLQRIKKYIEKKQDKLTAGENVKIEENIISTTKNTFKNDDGLIIIDEPEDNQILLNLSETTKNSVENVPSILVQIDKLKQDNLEYITKISGTNEIPNAEAKKLVSELESEFRRNGNKVSFFSRIKLISAVGTTVLPFFVIPDGFKITSDWDDTIWNAAITVSQYTEKDHKYNAFAERRGTNKIMFTSDNTGNHYLHGEWITDDGIPDWTKALEFRLSAHRGATNIAPENTFEAFSDAIKQGYKAVEMDIQMSADGQLFLMHDDNLDRTTNGTGKASSYTWNELSQFIIKSDDYEKYKDQKLRIPKFESIINLLENTNIVINIDGSKGNWEDQVFVKKLVDMLIKHNVFDKSFFVLSNKKIRDVFKETYPEARVSWLYDSKNNLENEINQVKSYGNSLLSISNSNATPNNIKTLNKSGIYYQVYSVNEKERATELIKSGVRMIETDTILPDNK